MSEAPASVAPAPREALDGERLWSLYETMLLIRTFELEALALLEAGEILGAVHPYVGHEAIAAGVCAALEEKDWISGYYRSHGHALARGLAPRRIMAEMMGRATGLCGGRGGSMHVAEAASRFLGGNSVVGANVAIGAGCALSLQVREPGALVAVFFGDGAMGTGIVLETLNVAAAQRLPILFVCENNLYQDMTRSDEVFPSTDLARVAEGFRIPALEVDGNDAEAVYAAVEPAAALVREGGGPIFVEARTYLGLFHSQVGPSPPQEYRPAAEAAAWRERDPLLVLRRALERGGMSTRAFSEAESRARGAVADAVAFARASPHPESL